MAATKNTLMAMWGKSSATKAKDSSSDLLSLHSTRSRAAEERSAPDKEATSRLSKPDIGRSQPAKGAQASDEDVCQTSTQGPKNDPECPPSSTSAGQTRKRKRAPHEGVTVIDLSQESADKKSNTAALSSKPDIVPDAKQESACMRPKVPPEKTRKVTPAEEQQEPKAGTPEEKAALLAELTAEAASLKQHVLGMQSLVLLTPDNSEPSLSRSQVAQHLLGCSQSLQTVTQHVLRIYSENGQDENLTETAVRNIIIDLAARKSFAAKDSATSSTDTLEDTSEDCLWQWELRDVKAIPKALKPAAKDHKKLMHKVAERLTALKSACTALEASSTGKASGAKLQKALAKLQKVDNPLVSQPQLAAPTSSPHASAPQAAAAASQLVEPGQGSAAAPAEMKCEAAMAPAVPSREEVETAKAAEAKDKLNKEEVAKQTAEKARQKAEREQARLKKEQEKQAREREKQEKAAAREKEKQEKERERQDREREKQEKAAEREKARQQREAEKQKEKAEREAKSAGFKTGKSQAKAAAIMHSFFKTPGKAQPERAASQPAESPQRAQKPQQPYLQLFTPAPERARLPLPKETTTSIDDALKAAEWLTEEELQQEQQKIFASWARATFRSIPGLPPSWARRRTAEEHIARFGDLSCAVLWRRKLLLPDPTSRRPAYFGSWRTASAVVKGRTPCAKDPNLDYEVMSDEEWEEEPEGESLSDDDLDDEEDEYEESEDGFVVPNGYISEDEGLGSVQQSLNDLCADLEDDAGAEQMVALGAEQGYAAQQERMRTLGKALEKANRAGKPIIISRLPGSASSQDSAATACLTGDPALLMALQPRVLASHKITMLPPPVTDAEPATGTAVPKTRERPDHEELVPDLEAFLKAHPEIKSVVKMALAFAEAHSERKVVKKWVTAKIKEIADHGVAGWVIKREHPVVQHSQDPAAQDENEPAAGVPSAGFQDAPATDLPSQNPGASLAANRNPFARRPGNMRALFGRAPRKSFAKQATPAAATAQDAALVQNGGPREGLQGQPSGDIQPKAVSSTADSSWQALLRHLAEGSPAAGKLLEEKLSAEALSSAGARSVPSTVVSALTKLLHASPGMPMRKQIWRALRNILKQLQGEGPAQVTSPSKAFSNVRSAPVAVTVEELLNSQPLHEASFRDAGESHLPVAMGALRFLGNLVSVGGSAPVDRTAATRFQATVAGNTAWSQRLLHLMQEGSHGQAALACQIWTSLLSAQTLANSADSSVLSETGMKALSKRLGPPCDISNKGMLEQCWDAFVDLLCHPALARATAYNSTSVADVVRKLLDCQDQHGFGAGAALTMMRKLADASGAGLKAVVPLHGFLSTREPVWRDLKRLEEAANLARLLETFGGPRIQVPWLAH